ncbi:MAG: MFS transporter, partial [Deltaproteobacteria bacterium]|nr:MFS transporter [Deltaproteobacteria bacterium]
MENSFLKRMASMGSSYMLGTFNDNFFKQSALLLAVSLGHDSYQAWGTLLFALPFVLFSAWGGWLADRFPKRNIVIAAKCVELAAMLIGAWGIVRLNWGAIMVMLFCMGGSSTLFNPALNGSIPELFPRDTVPKVNGIFKLCTTVTILLGVMLAGYALERTWIATVIPFGRWLVGGGVILAALLGLACAFSIPSWSSPVNRTARFPWLGAWDSVRDFWHLRSDRPLTITLAADMFFYGLSTLALLEINALGMEELGFGMTLTSLLPVALMAGICAGSLLAAKGTPESWKNWLVPAIVGIGLSLAAAGASAWLPLPKMAHFWCLMVAYGVAGLCGGLYIIPVSSFIQVRPSAGEKGRILGIGNCLSFAAIMMAGPAYGLMSFLSAATGHLLVGAATLLVAAVFFLFIKTLPEENPDGTTRPAPFPKSIARLLRFLVALRYRVTVEGMDSIRPDGRPLLFLPNHVALTDPIILYSLLAHLQPRPLADAAQIERPLVRTLTSLTRPITKPDLRAQDGGRSKTRAAVEEALKRCANALNAGDNLLFYPAGALTRDGSEHLGANSGVQRLLEAAPQTRVILVRTRGLWGSSFSYAEGQPDTIRGMLRGILLVLANLIFFMPKRRVHIHMEELPQAGQMAVQNLHDFNCALEAWYGTETGEKALVPSFFWQGSTPKALAPAPKARAASPTESAVSEELRREVCDIIAQSVDNANAVELSPETRLGADLGIDSLALTELAARLEEVQGHHIERLETLVTVEDCVLAAVGLAEGGEKTPEAPKEWFARDTAPALRLAILPADNLPQAILRQARKDPQSLILADAQGAMSWRSFWIKARALALLLHRRLPREERIGVMLPASGAATLSWLAVLLSGKTPIMLNWTTGAANFAHCLRLAGLSAILTARTLLDRLEDQGFEPEKSAPEGVRWLFLEDEVRAMPLTLKLAALVSSRLALLGWERLVMPKRMSGTAAILFTSGSETAPKGVPLSHANILANCRDIAKVATITSHDRMLAMLPPFHSLGLT